MILNLGNAVFIMQASARIRSGIIITITSASSASVANAIIRAPINIPGALNIILSAIATRFCRLVISLVSLVTSDPVENFSILANENF